MLPYLIAIVVALAVIVGIVVFLPPSPRGVQSRAADRVQRRSSKELGR